MIWTIVVLAVLALVLWGFWVSWRASRLDRLHNRVEAARTALDLALVRRASAASDLASSGQLDPATSVLLADAVRRARHTDLAERDLAESDLTRALRATLGDPEFRRELLAGATGPTPRLSAPPAPPAPPVPAVSRDAPAPQHAPPAIRLDALIDLGEPDESGLLLDEVEQAAHQVFIARKFYNDVAGRTLDARRRPLARVLRLSGSAPQPEFFDMDDALVDGDT